MTFDERTNTFTLSTGREISSDRAILAIDSESALCAHQQYDCDVYRVVEPLTTEEKREIASHMICRWLEWCGALPAGCKLHPVAMETCEECPRIDFRVNITMTPGAVRALMAGGGLGRS